MIRRRSEAEARVSGVLVARADPATVAHYLAELRLPTDGDLPAQIARLAEQQATATRRGDCDVCGAVCDLTLPVCPFCGVGDAEDAPAAAPAAAPAPATLADDDDDPPVVVVSATEIARPLPPPRWISRRLGMMGSSRPAVLAGYAGGGKTLLAQSLALAVAAGRPTVWGGVPLDADGAVLHLDHEQGPEQTYRRYQRLARGEGIDLGALGAQLGVAMLPRLRLTDDDAEAWIRELATGRVLVIIDSLRAAVRGVGENDSGLRESLDLLTRVSCATRCAFLVVAHEGKNSDATAGRPALQRLRGSSAIADAAGCVWSLTGRDGVLSIEHAKASYGRVRDPIACRFVDAGEVDEVTGSTMGLRVVAVDPTVVPAPDRKRDAARASMIDLLTREGAMSRRELVTRARGAGTAAKQGVLDGLVREGVVVVTAVGRGASVSLADPVIPTDPERSRIALPSDPSDPPPLRGGSGSRDRSGRDE